MASSATDEALGGLVIVVAVVVVSMVGFALEDRVRTELPAAPFDVDVIVASSALARLPLFVTGGFVEFIAQEENSEAVKSGV